MKRGSPAPQPGVNAQCGYPKWVNWLAASCQLMRWNEKSWPQDAPPSSMGRIAINAAAHKTIGWNAARARFEGMRYFCISSWWRRLDCRDAHVPNWECLCFHNRDALPKIHPFAYCYGHIVCGLTRVVHQPFVRFVPEELVRWMFQHRASIQPGAHFAQPRGGAHGDAMGFGVSVRRLCEWGAVFAEACCGGWQDAGWRGTGCEDRASSGHGGCHV